MYMNNRWSPFDPKWYQEAFDNFISTADQLFNQELIIKQGYHIPDADGSRSSVFRNNAILNNSFNEKDLRDTLRDIYLNSSKKLIASNHDNTHFFQWAGHMSDMTLIPNTNTCEFSVPVDTFITPKEKDLYKLSQFYRKWVKVEDILNNWSIFKWHCMLFINQKIYSEYELRMDDRQVMIRFNYNEYWVRDNLPVYIYKFDTSASCRVLISRHLCNNEWNWKMPFNYVNDKRVANSKHVMVTFNKISDQSIRTDGLTRIEVLGDNIEFLNTVDGCIDMTSISDFNRIYINSESTEWLWMSIIVPKFFHEYPILLPSESIYRPYQANLLNVSIVTNNMVQNVKASIDEGRPHQQVVIDANGGVKEGHQYWKQMIRPIVLADAFDDPYSDDTNDLVTEINNLRDLTVKAADILESFRFFIQVYDSNETFDNYLTDLRNIMHSIREAYIAFIDSRSMEYSKEYEYLYVRFIDVMNELERDRISSEWLQAADSSDKDFFFFVSPLIYIPRELADKYNVYNIIEGIGSKTNIWDDVDKYNGKLRFQRPVDESDFWTFEYYEDENVWRPYPLQITRHFPDVYLPVDTMKAAPSSDRVFKAFFFYSDTMNVINESEEIIHASASWNEDMQAYNLKYGATYRDIFMEKFYWMGVRSIYKGLLRTHFRWEVIEYVIDNSSYDRFNRLFMETMDPYFKLGLATYLKSSNFEFPFDDAVSKMKEAINTKWLGYKKITNFEAYLDKNWVPSYFDYVTRIMDDWSYGDRLLRRPRSTFLIDRLLPAMIDFQKLLFSAISDANDTMNWLISQLEKESYGINVSNIHMMKQYIQQLYDNMNDVVSNTNNLDMEIYSIEDINNIIMGFKNHNSLVDDIKSLFGIIYDDTENNNIYESKQALLNMVISLTDKLPELIRGISAKVQLFDIDRFMKAINDLTSYMEYPKATDESLLGEVNKFNDPWSDTVKGMRDKVFQSTAILYGIFYPDKSYSPDEIVTFTGAVTSVKDSINGFKRSLYNYWREYTLDEDNELIMKLDKSESLLSTLVTNVDGYMSERLLLVETIDSIKGHINTFIQNGISVTETGYTKDILSGLDDIIRALSYIVGDNREDDANRALKEIESAESIWTGFLNIEERVFRILFQFSKEPVPFMETLREKQDTIDAITDYMNTVNVEFVPDTSLPTYADVYKVNEIKITTGGFNNMPGDFVFIPSLGSYKITEVSTSAAIAVALEDTGYIGTMFRDPMCQNHPYDSITSGDGIGITVTPTSVTKQRMINDNAVVPYITRIRSILHLIQQNGSTINPHMNHDLGNALSNITTVQTSWDKLLDIYNDYLSDDMKFHIKSILDSMNEIIVYGNTLIDTRKFVEVDILMSKCNKYLSMASELRETLDMINDDFNNYRDLFDASYTKLLTFTEWNSLDQLLSVLRDLNNSITIFNTHIVEGIIGNESVVDLYDEITEKINSIEKHLGDIPDIITDVLSYLNRTSNMVDVISDDMIIQDVWYKLKSIKIVDGGKRYRNGDIVEIQSGDDILLFKITSSKDGTAMKIQSLMEYAIPYRIHGVFDVSSRVGDGNGLKLDIDSYKLELTDSTLFLDDSSDLARPNQFDESDMFVFKFENTHDLDIGYEVFYGGRQLMEFTQRHIDGVDMLYLNANEVNELRNSCIFIPAEHYFIYTIGNIEIVDPGMGYSPNQEIFVDTGSAALRLKIAKLMDTPYKEIEEVELCDYRDSQGTDDISCDNAVAADDSLNNIDDEFNDGYYDRLTKDGITKGVTRSYPEDMYQFISTRHDNLQDGIRNKTFMYPDVDKADNIPDGDPDMHFYQGSRIDNSQHPMKDDRIWNGIMNIIPPTDPFIPDNRRFPNGKNPKGEYQLIVRERIHNSIGAITGDYSVQNFASLPKDSNDWPGGKVGSQVIVECDEDHGGHRMVYRIRTFVAYGFFVYNEPEIADFKWDTFSIDFMNTDFYPDIPSEKSQYPTAPWRTAKTYREVQEGICDKKFIQKNQPMIINNSTYIHNVTVDDISVFNWTTKEWEDLNDTSRWKFERYEDDKWGFRLTMLDDGVYSYDMSLYLNKVPETQTRNSYLKKNAVFNIEAYISSEINTPAVSKFINTGRHLRIRKLFPYEQKETFRIGPKHGYEMNFKLSKYIHFKNEIHLEDIKIFNVTAKRFENILDPQMFEVLFKDDKAVSKGYETQTRILSSIITKAGEGFVDGNAWAWNEYYHIHVFGNITSNLQGNGHLLTFTPLYCPNPPTDDLTLEFEIYQNDNQNETQAGTVLIEFHTERLEVSGDGYIHDVRNPYAPVPDEFKVIVKYDIGVSCDYDIIISKSSRKWTFIENQSQVTPTFHLPDVSIQQDRLYMLTLNGRLPLVNPSTGKPMLYVTETANGTDVQFLSMYQAYEHIDLHEVPYPMRSVYVQRRIPQSGFIDLKGKLNKPLNRKYFEFWVNGKLLDDEVTIVSPSKLFLHGLRSLKNLEIIEINRDPNEFFSDSFITVEKNTVGRPFQGWDFHTYLDAALEGELEGDNYTLDEQENLLTPVWKQIDPDNPEYKNYPPNVDIEDDILMRVNLENNSMNGVVNLNFQFMINDGPTLESHQMFGPTLDFSDFGFIPITDEMLIGMMNDEWSNEIANNPYFPEHGIISDDEWYGMTTILYDEYGIRVHNLSDSAYNITDPNILKINYSTGLVRIARNNVTYDLT